MFEVKLPSKDSPGLSSSGLILEHPLLGPDQHLSRACGDLRLTTPIALTVNRLANREILTEEEIGLVPSLSIKRGPRDFLVTPMIGRDFVEDSGMLSTIEGLKLAGIFDELPKNADEVQRADHIVLNGYMRMQSLSVLWDLADGLTKASPHGSPKPWVVDELRVLGFISIGEPVKDGSRGRPPQNLIINSWGLKFVELTRKRGGIEISDAYRKAARRKSGNAKPRYTVNDNLAAGYLAHGREIPERVLKRMSEYGKEELSRAWGVKL